MKAKKILLSTVLVIGIVLLGLGMFLGNTNYVSADDKTDKIKDKDYIDSLRNNNTVEVLDGKIKTYIAIDKKLKLEDEDGIMLDMNLLTPYENIISPNYYTKPVAEWLLVDWNDKVKLPIEIDSYNKKDDYSIKNKDYIWKYLIETEIEYCYDGYQMNNITFRNDTAEICNMNIEKEWIEFTDVKDLPHKNIRIGLFTDAILGDDIEFIPTIEGFEIMEWAGFVIQDLIHYWKFDEGSGNFIDSQGSNNLTPNGGVTHGATGVINDAANFDNTFGTLGGSCDTGSTITLTEDFTYSFWVNPNTAYSERETFFFGSASERFIFLTGNFYLDNPGTQISFSSVPSHVNTYKHYMLTRSGTDYKLYINGVQFGGTQSGDIVDINILNIGGRSSAGTSVLGFDGEQDEIGIWDGLALDGDQALDLYNGGAGLPFPINCEFSGFVFDELDNPLEGANVTVWNQFDVTEFYENTTNSNGLWTMQIQNSTNTYMAGAYFNNTLIGQLKPYISGIC